LYIGWWWGQWEGKGKELMKENKRGRQKDKLVQVMGYSGLKSDKNEGKLTIIQNHGVVQPSPGWLEFH